MAGEIGLRRKIFLSLTIIWMSVIFAFSARPADESEEDSLRVGMLIGEVFLPGFEEWEETEQTRFAKRIDYPVRKTAHASEYALLALLVSGCCISKKQEKRMDRRYKEVFIPWAIAAAYAATDEFHQLFVQGRSGQVSDVLLDSAGAMAGILVLTGIRAFKCRYLEKSNL